MGYPTLTVTTTRSPVSSRASRVLVAHRSAKAAVTLLATIQDHIEDVRARLAQAAHGRDAGGT
jgi:hypothetical protein